MSFKSVQAKIARKGGYSSKVAGAILASASRNASPAAKRRNPNLKKVKMPKNPSPPFGKQEGTKMRHSAEGRMGIC